MASYLDSVPLSGIIRIRDMMYSVADPYRLDQDDVLVTHGGIHGLYMICRALLEPGDEVIVPDPEWPPAAGNILAARGVPVGCPLHETTGWRYDLDELASKITS